MNKDFINWLEKQEYTNRKNTYTDNGRPAYNKWIVYSAIKEKAPWATRWKWIHIMNTVKM